MRNIRVGSLLGIPILVNPSWFLLFGLLSYLLAVEVFPSSFEDASRLTYFAMAAASVIAFFVSIILHELAHSVVARAYQIPVKSITLFVFGGVAQITREAKKPLNELLMAIAGPLTSLVLAFAFLGAWWLIGATDTRAIDHVFFWLAITNGALAIFNMIPAFPMDGGRVFRSLIWLVNRNYVQATSIAAWTGRGFAWVMMALGFLALLQVDVWVANNPLGGVWLILIGLFLENAARQSLVQTKIIGVLDQYSANDLMLADPPSVPSAVTVGALARGVIELNPRVCYFVEEHGKLAGIISAYQMMAVPQSSWDTVTAGQAMVPSSKMHAIDPGKPGSEILIELEHGDFTHLPVVQDGRVLGVVGRDRILNILRQSGFLRSAAV